LKQPCDLASSCDLKLKREKTDMPTIGLKMKWSWRRLTKRLKTTLLYLITWWIYSLRLN